MFGLVRKYNLQFAVVGNLINPVRSGGSGQGPLGMCIPELNALNINGIVNVPFGVKFNVRLLSIIISVDNRLTLERI